MAYSAFHMALPISGQEHLSICLLLVRLTFFAYHQDRTVSVPHDRVRDASHQSPLYSPEASTCLTCSSSNRWPICLISSSCGILVSKPIVSYSEVSCVRKTKATCSSEPLLSARSTAVRAAKFASLEPSVARRIFVGKMLIKSPQNMLLYSSLLGCLWDADCNL